VVQRALSGREALPFATSKQTLALLIAKFETFDANNEKKCVIFKAYWHLISTGRSTADF
jgi:hypothetical protein